MLLFHNKDNIIIFHDLTMYKNFKRKLAYMDFVQKFSSAQLKRTGMK